MGLAAAAAGAALPFFCHNGDQFTQPPPAHMGIPPYQLETPRNATSAIGKCNFYYSLFCIVYNLLLFEKKTCIRFAFNPFQFNNYNAI